MTFLFFLWLSVGLFFLLFEMIYSGFFLFLSFCLGALAAALVSWLEYSILVQCTVALTVACMGCILLFYSARYYYGQFKKQGIDHQSNVYALVGRKGFVEKLIEPGKFGSVKLNGEIWMARSLHEIKLEQGQEIEVLYISGAHVVIQKIQK